jgi:hypothetical protein
MHKDPIKWEESNNLSNLHNSHNIYLKKNNYNQDNNYKMMSNNHKAEKMITFEEYEYIRKLIIYIFILILIK